MDKKLLKRAIVLIITTVVVFGTIIGILTYMNSVMIESFNKKIESQDVQTTDEVEIKW